jgi:hypothetical protein
MVTSTRHLPSASSAVSSFFFLFPVRFGVQPVDSHSGFVLFLFPKVLGVADSNIDGETAEGHLIQSTTLSRSSYIFPHEFLLSLLR